jgi:hypothetical protein
MSSFLNEKIKQSESSYLSRCDLTQKYCLKSLYSLPKVDKIVFELPIMSLTKSSNKQESLNAIAKGLMIFIVVFGCLPKIVYQKSLVANTKKIYSLQYTLKRKDLINSFLTLMFFSGFSQSELEEFILFKKTDDVNITKKKVLISNQNLTLSMPIFFNSFFELNDLFLDKGWDLSKDLFFKTSFVFNKTSSDAFSNKMIQNISPFWMSRHSKV